MRVSDVQGLEAIEDDEFDVVVRGGGGEVDEG